MKILELFFRIFIEQTLCLLYMRYHLYFCRKCTEKGLSSARFNTHCNKFMVGQNRFDRSQYRIRQLLNIMGGN